MEQYSLPAYGSIAFWKAIEETDRQKAIPLEVLVTCLRLSVANGDIAVRNRIIEVIIRRTQVENEYWTYSVLKYIRVSTDVRTMLADDLYADLCECLIRALLDPERLFWEKNFQHCLRFERQHVYSAFMRREGRGRLNVSSHLSTGIVEDLKSVEADGNTVVPRRIPRGLMYSLDTPMPLVDDESLELLIEDERAQEAFQAIEREDVPRLVMGLPQKLKAIVWLIFWEGRTEKDTAQVLGITDRTVRNRLREALKVLRDTLEFESASIHRCNDASASPASRSAAMKGEG